MTKHDLKELAAMGAELGAAKAENERLRGLLQQVVDCQAEHYGDGCGLHLSMITLAGRIKDALSQQPEPVRSPRTEDTASMDSDSAQEQFTAVDMATAAAQGFRDGQAAVEQAAVKDEREAFEAWMVEVEGARIRPRFDRVTAGPFADEYRDGRIQGAWNVWQARAARPTQTEQQPVAINPDPPELMIRWHESPESVHRAMWESVAIREGMTYDELLAEGVTCGFDESGNEVEMEAGADIEGMRMQGCWAFVDTLNSCIHAWAAPDTDRGLVLHMLAHEISHATGTPHPDGFQEEMRAEQFGRVAAAAYRMLLDKDRPQCTAPACGCADAFCMAWPDD